VFPGCYQISQISDQPYVRFVAVVYAYQLITTVIPISSVQLRLFNIAPVVAVDTLSDSGDGLWCSARVCVSVGSSQLVYSAVRPAGSLSAQLQAALPACRVGTCKRHA